MKSILIFLQLMIVVPILSQTPEFFIPAGFNNPFLRSGQFITSLYYYNYITESSVQDNTDSKSYNQNLNITGLIGITDRITLRADVVINPSQIVFEYIEGATGRDKETFNISPTLTLSYRPIDNLEIFGNIHYKNVTRETGDKGFYQDVPVGVDNDGNVIYERRLVTQYQSDYDYKSTSFKVGISYLGKLW